MPSTPIAGFDWDMPLVPLQADQLDVSAAPSAFLPCRPSFMPSSAPFGNAFTRDYSAWAVETYMFPAATPRTLDRSTSKTRLSSSPDSTRTASGKMSKDEIDKIADAIIDDKREAVGNLKSRSESPTPDSNAAEPLWITANRYYPVKPATTSWSSKEPVTLVFAHANGFNKETWEPTIAHLISKANGKFGPVKEMWTLDMVNHGDCGVLNKHSLGDQFDWSDNGRDLLQFLLSYLPEVHPLSPLASLREAVKMTASSVRGAVRWATEDASLSHWNVSADDMREAVLESITSAPASTEETKGGKEYDYNRQVRGWISEDSKTASVPGFQPDSNKFGEKEALARTPRTTFTPTLLPKQPLPVNFADALLLDGSASSAINNRSKPLPQQKWRGRRIVLVGHSVGGAGMSYAASTFPHLFESLILVDPTIFPIGTPRWDGSATLLRGSIFRKNVWASRRDAHVSMRKNKGFYGSWDKAVLDRYVFFGLDEDPATGSAFLKCDRMQETYVYADVDCIGSIRAFHRLDRIPPTTSIHVIRADVGHSTIPEAHYAGFYDLKHATHARIPKSKHLIAQDSPKELAYEIVRVLEEQQDPANTAPKAKL